jgi:hypothetical protein
MLYYMVMLRMPHGIPVQLKNKAILIRFSRRLHLDARRATGYSE